MRGRTAVAAIVAAGLVAGCGTPATPDPAALPADHVLIRVDEVSTFPSNMSIPVPLRLSLSAGGTLVAAGPIGESLVPAMTSVTVPAATVTEAWSRALDAGVVRNAELGIDGMFDATWTTITVDNGAGRTALRLYALGPWDATPEGTDAPQGDREQRAKARAFLGWLATQREGLAAAPYVPDTAVMVLAPMDGGPLSFPTEPWPGPMPLATAGDPLSGNGEWTRCAFLRGDAARAIIELATRTKSETGFSEAGTDWYVAVRPVLPGEQVTCRDVAN